MCTYNLRKIISKWNSRKKKERIGDRKRLKACKIFFKKSAEKNEKENERKQKGRIEVKLGK